jgi:sigma-B regulation protein RsbU (phosphoserine phosphatase)
VEPMLGAKDYEGALALLAEMTQGFATSSDPEETVSRALSSIVDLVGAEAGSVWILEEEACELHCLASLGSKPITGLRLPTSEGIVGRAVREGSCQRVLDVSRDPNFSARADRRSGFVTRSLLCSPLKHGPRSLGAVQLVNKRSGDGHFRDADGELLRILTGSAGLALANARLAQDRAEHERTRGELATAAEIQRGLLPSRRPAPFPIAGHNRPARTISGDFFDILPMTGERIGFCLGDVSGKSMNAALLMVKAASLYRCLAREEPSPGVVLARLNDELCETATGGMFVTMAAGILHTGSGEVVLANAGHEPPILHDRGGGFRDFPSASPPLGILEGIAFPDEQIALDGGVLYLCSDGVTEACSGGEELGSEGFRQMVARHARQPLSARIDAMAAEAAGLELRDDVTLLAVSGSER